MKFRNNEIVVRYLVSFRQQQHGFFSTIKRCQFLYLQPPLENKVLSLYIYLISTFYLSESACLSCTYFYGCFGLPKHTIVIDSLFVFQMMKLVLGLSICLLLVEVAWTSNCPAKCFCNKALSSVNCECFHFRKSCPNPFRSSIFSIMKSRTWISTLYVVIRSCRNYICKTTNSHC